MSTGLVPSCSAHAGITFSASLFGREVISTCSTGPCVCAAVMAHLRSGPPNLRSVAWPNGFQFGADRCRLRAVLRRLGVLVWNSGALVPVQGPRQSEQRGAACRCRCRCRRYSIGPSSRTTWSSFLLAVSGKRTFVWAVCASPLVNGPAPGLGPGPGHTGSPRARVELSRQKSNATLWQRRADGAVAG